MEQDVGSFLPAQQFNKRKRGPNRNRGNKKGNKQKGQKKQKQTDSQQQPTNGNQNQNQTGKKKRKRESGATPKNPSTEIRLIDLYGPDARANVELKLEQGGHIKAKDIQDLLLWCFGNGQNTRWIFVKNKPLISSAVVIVLRSVGKMQLEMYKQCFEQLRGLGEGGIFQKAPFAAPGSKNRVFETMYALLTCPKPKKKRRRIDHASPGQRPDTVNGQYLAAIEELTAKGAKTFPHYQYVLDQMELEQNCFPMEKYADLQRAAKEEAQRLQQQKKEQESAKKESIAVQKITQSNDGVEVTNYYSAIGEDGEGGSITIEAINEQEEEKKRQQELASRSTPYNLQRSSALNYEKFQALGAAKGSPLPYRRMLAVDCEMCVTTVGLELTRCTVVDEKFEVLYDQYVIPDNPIIDYVTRYSGVTAALLEGVSTKLIDVQNALRALFTEETILVGHSIENDLLALKLYHNQIIDTSLLYPHPNGPPSKQALRYLVQRHLQRNIQTTTGGHDSREDAKAAMELVQLKIIRGEHYGIFEEEGPSLFATLEESKKKIAMVDRPISLDKYVLGSQALAVPCATDDEIERELLSRLEVPANNSDSAVVVTSDVEVQAPSPASAPRFDVLWGQFHSVEDFYSKNPIPTTPRSFSKSNNEGNGSEQEKGKEKVKEEEKEQDKAKVEEEKHQEKQKVEGEEGEIPDATGEQLNTLLKEMDARISRVYAKAPPNTLFIVLSGRGPLHNVIGLQKRKTQSKWEPQDERLLEEAVSATREGMGFFCVKQ